MNRYQRFILAFSFLASICYSPNILAAIVTTGDTSLGANTFGDVTTGIVKVGALFTTDPNLSGTLEVNGGSVLTSKDDVPTPGVPVTTEPEPGGMIGRGPGSFGTVTVTGTNSAWRLEGTGVDPGITFGPYLLVGRDGGVGELNVEAGGKVILDGLGANLGGSDFSGNVQVGRDLGSDGSVLNISGPGSEVIIDNIDHTYFRMGNRRETSTGSGVFGHVDGEVNITDGGKLTVTGDNSLIAFRNGVVNVNTGGSIETNLINIGDVEDTTATMNLDGSSSSIHITGVGDANNDYSNSGYGGFFTIGGRSGAQATVNVTDGAKINIDDGTGFAADGTESQGAGFSLGGNSALGFGGQGTLNVDGKGSAVTVSTFDGGEFVGIGRTQGGGGTVNVTNGGQVIIENNATSDGVLMATNADSGTAILNVDGEDIDGNASMFDAGRFLGVGVTGGLANTAAATVTVTNSGIVKGETIAVGGAGTINGDGTLIGNVIVNPGGTIAPGLSPGTLIVDGNFDFTDGVLEIEIAGTAAGQYDVLDITGTANLIGGTILFSFLDGFLPQADDLLLEFLTADAGVTIGSGVQFDFQGVDESFELSVLSGNLGLSFDALNNALPPGEVPLPAAFWLFLSAMGLFGYLQKGNRRIDSQAEVPLAA